MGVFSDFHACGKFEKSLNATFLALIPKKPRASNLKDCLKMLFLKADKFWTLFSLLTNSWIVASSLVNQGCSAS
jgi:hypothetical protein